MTVPPDPEAQLLRYYHLEKWPVAMIVRQLRVHAVVLIDKAGWRATDKIVVPANLTMVNLPRYSPELNAIERVWQYLRDRYLSGCLFADDAASVDASCNAWNHLLEKPGRIRSLADRPWTHPVSP